MPRSNRPRRPGHGADDDSDLSHLINGWKRTEVRRGRGWHVQPVSVAQAAKDYVCPGCGGVVPARTAHTVVWRADGPLGDSADLAGRRHWHTHCWRIA